MVARTTRAQFASAVVSGGGGGGGGGTDPEIVRDTMAAALVAGAGIGIAVNDAGDTITLTGTGLTQPQVLARRLGA